ncbi:MAG: B12-binding domain-containing radical SAM protein [Gammaproteobacteria bacterium]|nr:B12-binding domain-containing radical SAM protein [Gammaproteobacteria bacterium]
MRIFLVHPVLVPTGPIEPPLGLTTLGAWLQFHGHEVRLVDLDLVRRQKQLSSEKDIVREFLTLLHEFEPELFGVTSMYSNSLQAKRLIQETRSAYPYIPIVAGGSHFGALPDAALKNIGQLDYVLLGEGEAAFLDLARCLEMGYRTDSVQSIAFRDGNKIVKTKNANLITMDQVANTWDEAIRFLNISDYQETATYHGRQPIIYVELGRGCPYKCSFCATAPFWRHKFRVRPVNHIVDEIDLLHEYYGYNKFIFVHDLPTADKRFVSELADTLMERKLPIEWMANSRLDISLDGIAPKMKAAGCWKLFFGAESGSVNIQSSINKNIDINNAHNLIDDLAKLGISATCSFVFGLNQETRQDFLTSIMCAVRLKMAGAETIQFHRVRIWPPAPISYEKVDTTFDLESLEIEYPFLAVDKDDIEVISSDREFFGGYFVPSTSIAENYIVAKLEMFFHHGIAITPMTIWLLAKATTFDFIKCLVEILHDKQAILRENLDWDNGTLSANFEYLEPVFLRLFTQLEKSDYKSKILQVFEYEKLRVNFAEKRISEINSCCFHAASDLLGIKLSIDIDSVVNSIKEDNITGICYLDDDFSYLFVQKKQNCGVYVGKNQNIKLMIENYKN